MPGLDGLCRVCRGIIQGYVGMREGCGVLTTIRNYVGIIQGLF